MSENHGNTPAAWTGVALGMVAFVVGSIALMLRPVNLALLWIGLALLPIALVVWLVMDRMGMGEPR